MKRDELSALFTWRSAVQSTRGPVDYELATDKRTVRVKAATQRHVALALSLYMNERGASCFPSVDRLAADCKLSDRAIQQAIRALTETGWLVARISRGGRRGARNTYRASFPTALTQALLDDIRGVNPVHPSEPQGVNPVPENPEPGSPESVMESENSSGRARENYLGADVLALDAAGRLSIVDEWLDRIGYHYADTADFADELMAVAGRALSDEAVADYRERGLRRLEAEASDGAPTAAGEAA